MQYEAVTGSVAYGVATATSDRDVYGFCIPPKAVVFPHVAGEIPDFGQQKKRFNQYQQSHSQDTTLDYDFSVYNIVRYFSLCMANNPNMLDSLFVPDNCVLYATKIGRMVRAARTMFLHKGSCQKFTGYAHSQLNKMLKGNNPTKAAYHVVRLVDEAREILTQHNLTLATNVDRLRAVRRGEWDATRVQEYFAQAEVELGALYESSTLQHKPDEEAIKKLLLQCLEEHYGNLDGCVRLNGGK